MSYSIDRGSLDALVQNKGVVSAAGSEVILSAKAADDIGRAVINQTGLIEAQALEGQDGTIRLLGDMRAGEVQLAGKLDATALTGGKGGLVETSGAIIRIDGNTDVNTLAELSTGTAGKWLVQGSNLVIANETADNRSSLIPADMLSRNLRNTNVELKDHNGIGSGDIVIAGKVAWNGINSLTLSASRNIGVHADISATDTAGTVGAAANPRLVFKYNQAGDTNNENGYFLGNGARISLPAGLNFQTVSRRGGLWQNHVVITELGSEDSSGSDLQGAAATSMNGNYIRYVLGADIDASQTARWNGGAGFKPFTAFYGVLDGLGHRITNLNIAVDPSDPQNAGLIGLLREGALVQNLTMASGIVSNSGPAGSSTGSVVGNNAGTIKNVHSTMTVESPFGSAGGLVGYNAASGRISGSSANGVVRGSSDVGGLAGISDGLIENSYATGSVTGSSRVGGLVGHIAGGTVKNSYASTGVAGNDMVGGLVGLLESGQVEFSYAAGNVSGKTSQVGGLIGKNNAGIVRDGYWDKEATRQETSAGGIAKTASEMRSLATFSERWSIDNQAHTGAVWRIYDGQTMPLLRSFLKKVDIAGQMSAYNGQQQQGCANTACNAAAPADPSLSAATGIDAGTYAPSSNQQGYDIRGGALTITPLALKVSALPVSKDYDRDTSVKGGALTIVPFARDDVSVSFGSATYADWNVGERKPVTFSGIRLSGTGAANYVVPGTTTQDVGKIVPRTLGANGLVADKVYDGTTAAVLLVPAMLQNQIAGDDVQVQTNAAQAFFADKGAGVAKPVTITGLGLAGDDAGNYTFGSELVTSASIQRRALTISVRAEDKVYDGNVRTTATLGDDRVRGDALDLAYGDLSFADSNAGSGKPVTASGISVSGADATNYVFNTSANGTASINRASLIVTANPDIKSFDGTPYRGGNGVTYAGFVSGENESVLGGSLAYRGNAQDAVYPGRYLIKPTGYVSQNYGLTFVDGELTIRRPEPNPVYEAAQNLVAKVADASSTMLRNGSLEQVSLRIERCGTRLPEGVMDDACPDAVGTQGRQIP